MGYLCVCLGVFNVSQCSLIVYKYFPYLGRLSLKYHVFLILNMDLFVSFYYTLFSNFILLSRQAKLHLFTVYNMMC